MYEAENNELWMYIFLHHVSNEYIAAQIHLKAKPVISLYWNYLLIQSDFYTLKFNQSVYSRIRR